MRNISLAVVVLGACLAWSFLSHAPAVGQDEFAVIDGGTGGPAGQTPWAGTFLLEGSPTWHILVQIHADGTIWSTDQTDFGGANVSSPSLGSWRRTGPRQATYVALVFQYDSNGEPSAYYTLTSVVDWDVGFDTASGVTHQRDYELDEDPLDPDQGTPVGVVPWTARRIVP